MCTGISLGVSKCVCMCVCVGKRAGALILLYDVPDTVGFVIDRKTC